MNPTQSFAQCRPVVSRAGAKASSYACQHPVICPAAGPGFVGLPVQSESSDANVRSELAANRDDTDSL